jgi:hypothetical protein
VLLRQSLPAYRYLERDNVENDDYGCDCDNDDDDDDDDDNEVPFN